MQQLCRYVLFAACSCGLMGNAPSSVMAQASSETLALPSTLEMTDFIELVSRRLGVSVQYREEDVRRSVALRLHESVSDDELWDILISVLEGQGLVVVEAEHRGLYRVVPTQKAAAENQQLVIADADGAIGDGAGQFASYISVLTRLESLSPDQAASAAKPILSSPGGAITGIGTEGLVLITDVKRRVEQALEVLRLLDGPADPVVSFVMELDALRPSELSDYMERIAAARLSFKTGAGRVADEDLQTPRIVELPNKTSVLVVVPQSQADSTRELISSLDVSEASEVRIYPVSRIPLDDLAAHISAVLALSAGDSAPHVTADSPTRGSRKQQLLGGAGGAVYADRLTNALHIRATPTEHVRIAAIIEGIEAAGPMDDTIIRSFVARNRPADELVQVIDGLLGGAARGDIVTGDAGATVQSDSSSPAPATLPRRSAPPRGGVASEGANSGGDDSGGGLTVDEATNTILAVGPRSWVSQVEALIEQLDQRQPQVMIDVTLVTLSEGEAVDFGVELSHQFSEGSTEVNLASLFGLSSGDGMGSLATGTGFSGLVLNPGDFEVVVRALEAVNVGRSTSRPRMLVDNNATSTLRSVASEPFTSLNASDTVATTSFGGTQDAGTTVTVTPHIGAGDHLSLEYSVELSAFTGQSTTTEGGGVIPPPSQQNTLDGSVTIPDDYTVVIGGIRNTSDGRSTNRVPILGELPILGALFGTTSESESESRFYVFIRASILRDQLFEGLRAMSQRDLGAAGVDDSLPRMEPLWID